MTEYDAEGDMEGDDIDEKVVEQILSQLSIVPPHEEMKVGIDLFDSLDEAKNMKSLVDRGLFRCVDDGTEVRYINNSANPIPSPTSMETAGKVLTLANKEYNDWSSKFKL